MLAGKLPDPTHNCGEGETDKELAEIAKKAKERQGARTDLDPNIVQNSAQCDRRTTKAGIFLPAPA